MASRMTPTAISIPGLADPFWLTGGPGRPSASTITSPIVVLSPNAPSQKASSWRCGRGRPRSSTKRAIRRSVPIVAALGRASTPSADYCFDQGASTEAASTRCAFVATSRTAPVGNDSPAFAQVRRHITAPRRGRRTFGQSSSRSRSRAVARASRGTAAANTPSLNASVGAVSQRLPIVPRSTPGTAGPALPGDEELIGPSAPATHPGR